MAASRAFAVGLLAAGLCAWAAALGAAELTPAEAAGKRIFTEGVSPSGANLSARVGAAGTPVPAAVVRCANCHGADGRGRAEGGVRPSDITWRRLSAGGQRPDGSREHPPYDEAAFARAVTQGIDPAGNRLDPAMPRFVISMRDLADLTAYLKRIEDDQDPGLTPGAVRIGTLLPGSGPLAEAGQIVAAVLGAAFDEVNAAGGIHGRRVELVVADPGGGRESAAAALRALAADQVFALVAPLVPALEGGWGELADAAGLPTVGPLALHSEGPGSRFVFDPLAGLQEQMLALAEFATAGRGVEDPPAAVVHPDDAAGHALAHELRTRLGQRGWSRVETLSFGRGQRNASALAAALAAPATEAVFFIGRGDDFDALARALAAHGRAPSLYAAGSQVAAVAHALPAGFAGRVHLAYPTLPSDWTPAGSAALEAVRRRGGLDARHAPLQVRAYVAALVLAEGLKRAGRDASRAGFVAALERLYDFRTGVTPALGFAPGRRVGAPGAHVVRLDPQQGHFTPLGRFVRAERAPH